MSQDFAKTRQPPGTARQTAKRAATRRTETPATHWRWYFSGVATGFLIVAIAYVGMIRLDEELDQATIANTIAEDGTPLEPAIDYSFYDELANAEVTVEVSPAPGLEASGGVQGRQDQKQAIAKTSDNNHYLLQAGSFQQREEAERRRVDILMMNLDARITPDVLSGRTWYRVMVGPFGGRASADTAISQLSASNIESILLIQRDSLEKP